MPFNLDIRNFITSGSLLCSAEPKMLDTMPASATPTPTAGSEKQKFLWQRPKLARSAIPNHKVSFSSSSKGSRDNEYSSHSDSSRPTSPAPLKSAVKSRPEQPWSPQPDANEQTLTWQRINRQDQAVWQETPPTFLPLPSPQLRPFLIYHDSFLAALGSQPTLQLLINDSRAPYFQNSGIFSPKTNTLFLSSAPIPDLSPAAAPSRNLAITISKIDFFSSTDFSRDKVRTPDHTYMPSSGCAHNSGIVFCAQGTHSETAALIFMETRRPHRTYPLLTNYYGTPLNSPHSCVAHADGSLWFSDPHLSHTPSFRPKPQLPPMVYRFDPQSAEVRAMTNEIGHPTAIAFSPSCRTLYVVDGATKSNISMPTASSRSTIYAFSVSQPNTFLTHKRLFALPAAPPSALVVDVLGNVYAACPDGVHAFNEGGAMIGRITIDDGATGLCFGRNGELWVCGGERVWRVQLDAGTKGAALGV